MKPSDPKAEAHWGGLSSDLSTRLATLACRERNWPWWVKRLLLIVAMATGGTLWNWFDPFGARESRDQQIKVELEAAYRKGVDEGRELGKVEGMMRGVQVYRQGLRERAEKLGYESTEEAAFAFGRTLGQAEGQRGMTERGQQDR